MSAPATPTPWHETRGTDLLLRVRVQPRASHEGIEGVREGRLRIRVSAPPVEGAANTRVVELLAERLDLPRSSLAVVRGARGRDKEVRIRAAGPRAQELIARLGTPVPGR